MSTKTGLIPFHHKAWVVATIPENTVGHWFFDDFLAIVHVRNTAIAFSMGSTLPIWIRLIFFVALPVVLLAAVLLIFFNKDIHLSAPTRWTLALFMGGGIGNLIDRIFRSPGFLQGHVVDFVSVFGPNAEYFPVFNVADSAITIGGISLVITALLGIDFDGTRTRTRRAESA